MIRSILVPLDGSDFAEHALPLAAALARQAGATLHLAHAHVTAMPEMSMGIVIPDSGDLHMRQDEQAYLTDVARRLTEAGPLKVETALLDGEIVAALKDQVQRHAVELVVMATHARGAFGRFWLGSVADDLTAALTQPVLLVRPGEGKPDLKHAPALPSIVVPLDGTPLAEKAIGPALELARLFNAEFNLVRVNKPPIRPSYVPEGYSLAMMGETKQIHELLCREREEAQKYLDGIAARLAAKGARVRTHVLIEEEPTAGILAEGRHAGLIAIETHGRRGLARMFFGSVADEVVRGSEVPVLLQHAAD